MLPPRIAAREMVRRGGEGFGDVGNGMLNMAARLGELKPATGDFWVALPLCLGERV